MHGQTGSTPGLKIVGFSGRSVTSYHCRFHYYRCSHELLEGVLRHWVEPTTACARDVGQASSHDKCIQFSDNDNHSNAKRRRPYRLLFDSSFIGRTSYYWNRGSATVRSQCDISYLMYKGLPMQLESFLKHLMTKPRTPYYNRVPFLNLLLWKVSVFFVKLKKSATFRKWNSCSHFLCSASFWLYYLRSGTTNAMALNM